MGERRRSDGVATVAGLPAEGGYRALFDHSPDSIYIHDLEGRFLDANPAALALLGYQREEIRHLEFADIVADEDELRRAQAKIAEIVQHGRQGAPERFTLRRKDKRLVRVEVVSTPVLSRGKPVAIQGIARDLTERMKAEEAARFQALILDSIDQAVIASDPEGRIVYSNRSAERLYGWSTEELLGHDVRSITVPRTNREQAEEIMAELAAGRGWSGTLEVQRRDGSVFPAAINDSPVLDDDGRVIAIVGLSRDIGQLEAAEKARRASEKQYRDLVELTHDLVWAVDLEGRITKISDASRRIYGRSPDEMIGRHFTDFSWPDDVKNASAELARGVATGQSVTGFESRMRHRDGHQVVLQANAVPIRDQHGNLEGFFGTSRDVTASKQAEADLQLQSAALEAAADAMLITDRTARILWINRAFTELTGYQRSEAIGRNPVDLVKSGVHGPDFYRELWETILAGKVWRGEMTNRRKNGTLYPEDLSITPVTDERGETTHFIGIKRDLTRYKKLEAQYLQAQKMETLGRLAGGIAHDFNNLLTVINGTADLAASGLPTDDPLHEEMLQILAAGERAAALTRQLLAFSRQQIMQPVALDLARLAHDSRLMLQRLVGEQIEVVIDTPDPPAFVTADPGQIEQVLMNLVVNARDAMPSGGRLTLGVRVEVVDPAPSPEADRPPPGHYVVLRVRDTGIGMDEATRAHIFEPFFTTKGPTEGTGLGLATVYGIVQQTNGSVVVESAPGHGSAFDIYLPRSEAPSHDRVEMTRMKAAGGDEVVMVVEDETSLRRLARAVLEAAGYSVHCAASIREARELFSNQALHIDLLFTDMVLTDGTGTELAREGLARRPATKLLITSGYSADSCLREDVLRGGAAFLPKPYTATELKHAIRAVLDGT